MCTRYQGAGLLVIALSAAGVAPVLAQVGERFLQAQRENALALRKYQWKSRVEVRRGGETSNVQVFLMRYGLDGSLQRTPIGGAPAGRERPRPPLVRRIAEKKTKEVQELVRQLTELAQSYASLPPERMPAALAGARMITPLGGATDSVQVQATGVLQPGDSVTMSLESATHQQQRVEVRTFLDAKPVTVMSEFRRLPEGPTYAARVVVEYPSETLQIVTDSFDYEG